MLINPLSPLTTVLAISLALVVAASILGLGTIIGTFLAGMIATETRQPQKSISLLYLISFPTLSCSK